MYMSYLRGACFSLLFCGALHAETAKPKHVVLINMDDLGYGDTSCYGATAIQTPHIDSLANSGIRFTDAHSASSFCSPSRYSLMTGRHSLRSNSPRLQKGIFLPGGAACAIAPGRFTLAKVFKQAGYKTALIGKWHIGDGTENGSRKYDRNDYTIKPGPLDFGFDYFYGHLADRHLAPMRLAENRHLLRDDQGNFINTNDEAMGVATGLFARRAVRFLKENADQSSFLYLNPNVAHLPHTPSEPFKGKSKAGYYGDFIVEGDWLVGQIIQTLRELDVLNDTLLVFTSDNGGDDIGYAAGCSFKRWPNYYARQEVPEEEFPWTGSGHLNNGDLAGRKASAKEGGHRVPLIVHWPAVIKQGKVSDALICQIDFLSSFASLLQVPVPDGEAEDSMNAMDNLLGKDEAPTRQEFIMLAKDGTAIRQGDWKLFRGIWTSKVNSQKPKNQGKRKSKGEVSVRLFNLREDMAEQNNLADKYPEKVKELTALMDRRIDGLKNGLK